MMRSEIIVVALLALTSNSVKAQPISLDSVLNAIELRSPMLRSFDEQISSARAAANGSTIWMPPTVSTGLWQTPYSNFQEGMVMFTIQQMMANPSKVKASREYTLSIVKVDSALQSGKRNDVFAMAKRAYYEVVLLDKKIGVLTLVDSLLMYLVDVSKARYKFNQNRLGNALRAEAELYEVRNMILGIESEIAERKVELNTLMFVDPLTRFDVDTTLPNADSALKHFESNTANINRSDIRGIDATLKSLVLKQELLKASGLPDFGASFSHMQAPASMPNQFSAMVMMTMPFLPWTSTQYNSAIESNEFDMQAVRLERMSRLNEIKGKVRILRLQIESFRQQLFNYEQAIVPTYQKSFESALRSYEQNGESMNIVLDALRMLRMARFSALDVCSAQTMLLVELDKELEVR